MQRARERRSRRALLEADGRQASTRPQKVRQKSRKFDWERRSRKIRFKIVTSQKTPKTPKQRKKNRRTRRLSRFFKSDFSLPAPKTNHPARCSGSALAGSVGRAQSRIIPLPVQRREQARGLRALRRGRCGAALYSPRGIPGCPGRVPPWGPPARPCPI